MSEKRAIYAGSFDPPTKGHEWMINSGAGLFDTLIVLAGTNPDKKYLFSLHERLAMLESIRSLLPNVAVSYLPNMLLADFAKQNGSTYLLRGLRNEADFRYEVDMLDENADLNPRLETVLLVPPASLRRVSSSFVKGLTRSVGWENATKRHLPESIYPIFFKKILDNELAGELRVRWFKLCRKAKALGDIEGAFNELVARYTESHRYYHTLDHILGCLTVFDRVRHLAKHPLSLEFSIFIHDGVYNVGPNVSDIINVEQSAELLLSMLKDLNISIDISMPAEIDVLATKHNFIPKDSDQQLMIDIDLYSLSTPEEVFDWNTANIRKEFSWVQPDSEFDAGRVAFMQRFLDKKVRPSIYMTEYFQSRYEALARENLERYVKKFTK